MRDFVRTELEGQGGRSFSSADHTHSSNSSIILEQLSPRLLNERYSQIVYAIQFKSLFHQLHV